MKNGKSLCGLPNAALSSAFVNVVCVWNILLGNGAECKRSLSRAAPLCKTVGVDSQLACVCMLTSGNQALFFVKREQQIALQGQC